MVIKENIQHFEETKYKTSGIQAIVVNIRMKSKDVTVAVVYCSLGQVLDKNYYIQFLQAVGDHFIGGDYHTKHIY